LETLPWTIVNLLTHVAGPRSVSMEANAHFKMEKLPVIAVKRDILESIVTSVRTW